MIMSRENLAIRVRVYLYISTSKHTGQLDIYKQTTTWSLARACTVRLAWMEALVTNVLKHFPL